MILNIRTKLPVSFRVLLATIIGSVVLYSCGPKLQLTPLVPAEAPLSTENGMVVAAHPMAAEAGVEVLKNGGNAIDAAIAALFMLNVVEPHASGLGGGGFALVRMADGESKVVVYREKTPSGLDTSFYTDPADTSRERLRQGGSSVCVPGAAAGWAELYSLWGTQPLEQLMEPAIRAAENGFPVDPTLASQIKNNFENISSDSLLAGTFLNEGLPYEIGDTLQQPELANTLRTLQSRGLRSFYRGPVADAVVEACREDGGFMSHNDLEFYRADVVDPLEATFEGIFRDYEALTVPPPSGGGTALIEALRLFEITRAVEYPQQSPEAIHMQSQCIQQAYADVDANISDSNAGRYNWREISSSEFAQKAASGISLEADAGPRSPVSEPDLSDQGNTTHLVVVDRWGNAVSITQSINWFFGSGVMAPGTGLLLNNQMADFALPPDSVNVLTPGKRPRSNMTPLILLRDGKPYLVVGTPGGARIVAAMAQIVVNVVSYRMDISNAIDFPRYFPVQEHLVLENRISKPVLKKLKKFGYTLHFAGPWHNYFGGAHGILVDRATGKLTGAADKRRGGAARGY